MSSNTTKVQSLLSEEDRRQIKRRDEQFHRWLDQYREGFASPDESPVTVGVHIKSTHPRYLEVQFEVPPSVGKYLDTYLLKNYLHVTERGADRLQDDGTLILDEYLEDTYTTRSGLWALVDPGYGEQCRGTMSHIKARVMNYLLSRWD